MAKVRRVGAILCVWLGGIFLWCPLALASPPGFVNSLGMQFVYIAPGSFVMGPPRVCAPQAGGAQSVTLTEGFFLQTTEVLQGQWKQVCGDNPSFFSELGDDFPVERVSWEECVRFITLLNRLEKTAVYGLPTEAQWEYACLGGSPPPARALRSRAWFKANAGGRTHRAATRLPNTFGLYDMEGNVYEWCYWYAPYAAGSLIDPIRPRKGATKVMRGGAWLYPQDPYCCARHRRHHVPHFRNSYLGFRVAAKAAP